MNNKDFTIKYCPYQKQIFTQISIPNFGDSRFDKGNTVTKVIKTSVTFNKCLRDDCPFYSDSSFPNCKRAIEEVKYHD